MGDYYVNFGLDEQRDWEDARQYGYISAGCGRRFSHPLLMLNQGDRVFVKGIPGRGYLGVGIVEERVVPVTKFNVTLADGAVVPILQAPGLRAKDMGSFLSDPDKMEYLVRVRWIHTVPLSAGIQGL